MRDPAKFRNYAEECRRLAHSMPAEHRGTLLKMADAWMQCAREAERVLTDNDTSASLEDSATSESLEDSAPHSYLGIAKQNRAARPPPWWV
jgi:hypothetical protein